VQINYVIRRLLHYLLIQKDTEIFSYRLCAIIWAAFARPRSC